MLDFWDPLFVCTELTTVCTWYIESTERTIFSNKYEIRITSISSFVRCYIFVCFGLCYYYVYDWLWVSLKTGVRIYCLPRFLSLFHPNNRRFGWSCLTRRRWSTKTWGCFSWKSTPTAAGALTGTSLQASSCRRETKKNKKQKQAHTRCWWWLDWTAAGPHWLANKVGSYLTNTSLGGHIYIRIV